MRLQLRRCLIYGALLAGLIAPGQAQNKRRNCSIKITGPLWFFGLGNAVPSTFTQGNVQTVLSLRNPGPSPYTWEVTNGSDKASFASGTPQPSLNTGGTSATLYSISYSTKKDDVTVQVTDSGGGGASIKLSIDSPFKLSGGIMTPLEAVGNCGSPGVPPGAGNAGCYEQYQWQVKSYLNRNISGQYTNESFANIQQVYPGDNLSFTANGWPGVAGASQFVDTYCYANQTVGIPPARPPQHPLGNVMIDFATQTYSIGSMAIGGGIPVQSQTLTRYQDHPTVTNIVSPVRSN